MAEKNIVTCLMRLDYYLSKNIVTCEYNMIHKHRDENIGFPWLKSGKIRQVQQKSSFSIVYIKETVTFTIIEKSKNKCIYKMFGNDYKINREIDVNSNKLLMRLLFAGPIIMTQSSSAIK